MNKQQAKELKSSRLFRPALIDDLSRLALYAKALSKTGQCSSAVLQALESKLLQEYYRVVADPFKLIPDLHFGNLPKNDDPEMIDAHLALRLHSWTFGDFMHLPENLLSLEALRSGVEMTAIAIIDPDNDYNRGHSSPSVSRCKHFEEYRYATISEGCCPLQWLDVEATYAEVLSPADVEDFEIYMHNFTEYHGITTEDARAETMRRLIPAMGTLDVNATDFDLLPDSHTLEFAGQKFFCRHPVHGEYGQGRHYSFADPIGRPLIVKDIKDFVASWNLFCEDDQKITSPGSMKSKLSRDGHYKNLFGDQVMAPKDKMILVNKSIEPRTFATRSLLDRESCLRFQEYTTNSSRFLDVSTPYLQKKSAEQFGFKTFEQLMNAYGSAWQMTTITEYFGLDLVQWTPASVEDDSIECWYEMNNNFTEFLI